MDTLILQYWAVHGNLQLWQDKAVNDNTTIVENYQELCILIARAKSLDIIPTARNAVLSTYFQTTYHLIGLILLEINPHIEYPDNSLTLCFT